MTTIVFLIDNSASMNQRTIQGTTLLDVAKTAVEIFFKLRLSKSRVDRYIILTLDSNEKYIKLLGWGQNVDVACLHNALTSIDAVGQTPLNVGLERAFRILNLNRMHQGYETYGMGMLPCSIEPAVVICITDGTTHGSSTVDCGIAAVERTLFDCPLTDAVFRWDYRLYSIILRYPAFAENYGTNPFPTHYERSDWFCLSRDSGGHSFIISDNRELNQCLETIASKCQHLVVINFSFNATCVSASDWHKQLVHVRVTGKPWATWPIPEVYWPTDDLSPTRMPPRPAHPSLVVSCKQEAAPDIPERFPVDIYDLEPSAFTKLLCSGDPNKVWPCSAVNNLRGQDALPCGYLKLIPDSQQVQLHLLPYNYHVLLKLAFDAIPKRQMTEAWGQQFIEYLSGIPRYYLACVSKAFEQIGIPGLIKSEVLDAILPYDLKNALIRLRHHCRLEHEKLVNDHRSAKDTSQNTVSSVLPSEFRPSSEWRSSDISMRPTRNMTTYIRACEIERRKLRCCLRKMRQNLDTMLTKGTITRHSSLIHQQPVAVMGDYINYRSHSQKESPLREVNPTPERIDMFGNPFRRKSSNFVADEVFVDEMGLSSVPGGANATNTSPQRRKRHPSSIFNATRNKGPLPTYINHWNWREFSPKNSPTTDLYSDHQEQRQMEPDESSPTKPTTIPLKEAFTANKKLVNELTNIIRQPFVDGQKMFSQLNDLCGTIGQKYAAVSVVMAEALRFKRSSLYSLLRDWCASTLPGYTSHLTEISNPPSNFQTTGVQVNGWK